MGQGLEPLTADLCLSSRSQPPQLPSRADFFEQSKKRNVFKASTVAATATSTTSTSSTKALLPTSLRLRGQGRRGRPTVKPLPAGHQRNGARVRRESSSSSARVHLATCQKQKQQLRWWPQRGQRNQGDTRSTLSSMLPDFPSNANTMEFG